MLPPNAGDAPKTVARPPPETLGEDLDRRHQVFQDLEGLFKIFKSFLIKILKTLKTLKTLKF